MRPTPHEKPETTRELEHNSQLFRQVLDASGVAMAIRDAELLPLFANQAFTDFYGYDVNEMIEVGFERLLPPESLDLLLYVIRPAIHEGKSWEGEYAIRTKHGRMLLVWSRFDPVTNAEGDVTHSVSIMRDASDQARLRNALTQTERHLHFLAENTSDCLFRLRLSDGRYDYISSAVTHIVGYSPQDFYSSEWFIRKLFPEDWLDTYDYWLRELQEGRASREYESPLVHKDGTIRWVNQRFTVVKDGDGAPVAVEGIFTDVTDRRLAQEELAAAQMSLNFMSKSTSDIFFRMAIPSARYEYISPSVERFSGYTPRDYLDNPLFASSLLPPQWQGWADEVWQEMLEGTVRPEYEFQFIHKSGEVRWALQRVVMHKDKEGRPVAIEGIVSDITDRKGYQSALEQSESRFRSLFEESPISLWEEDLTRLKLYFDELKQRGVTDFREFFYANPDKLAACAELVEVVAVNKATLELLRAKSREDLLGNLDKVLTESSMAAFTEEMILLASGGCEYCGEITHRTLEGDIIWVVAHFIVPDDNRETLSRVIVSLQDVTPRKRAEQALMESEERYRVLVENAQEGVVVMQGGTPKYINHSMTRITGYSMDELHRMTSQQVIHPSDRASVKEQMAKIRNGTGTGQVTPVRIYRKDGSLRWLTLTVKSIFWGGSVAYLEILNDITVHKSLEEGLRKAHAEMEDNVNKRTAELSEANIRLHFEVEEREKARRQIRSLTGQLLGVQEDERHRISRDLHDNVAQDLSSIVLNMETLFDGYGDVPPALKTRGAAIVEVLRGAISNVRDISYGLRPPALDQLGLVKAVENHCDDVGRRMGASVRFMAVGLEDSSLDLEVEINVYRIIQEATNNMVKHSGASRVSVRMVKSHPDLLVRLEDNGCGFDVAECRAEADVSKRMGLRSMEERVCLVDGSMDIQSLVGTGTRIVVRIPMGKGRKK